MRLCPNCAVEVISGAKFCHRCGDKVAEKTKDCPACQEDSPYASVFCHHCGFHFEGKKHAYTPVFPLKFEAHTMTEQVKALFFKQLRDRVEEEHLPEMYSAYVGRFYESKFKELYAVRSKQIGEDAILQWQRFGTDGLPEIDRRIDRAFEGLLDYFIIQYCPDLNGMILPAEILKYEHALPSNTDMSIMVADFLDFGHEDEQVYTDFISMDTELLSNVCKSYLRADRQEKVYCIVDLSFKGNGKEGFALTDAGLFWRAPFDRARRVLFKELYQLHREKAWLTINGHFFNANPSLNLKLYKLLKKLRSWHLFKEATAASN